ncbi:MAG TPA: aconitase/3-isopropylmalate dehydratase large subunit family protein [Thermoanaerobaculia bacterium]|nr:aconitase/3-isopropylmalate dehydratase large subunit family protein [Thermoanaerobaculia bacterium]HUM30024.1 aconitase/3-isopropylmalate dehydratase large subunit family protein [Thermoanaerobaculia bacterium]HXK68287.1 aconitase/3-isopropylmalate dehydratase large subunit family protein [Thermoanaerobaculia bacterium]
MAFTIIEKIFSRHSSDPVKPGAIIWLDIDVRTARDFAGANVVKNYRKNYGSDPVADVAKTYFTFDCNAPANTIPYANNQMTCRTFAEEQGIRVFDVDAGVGTHVLLDEGLVGPGDTAVGTDSHFNILGAVGVFGQGMGDTDIAFAFKTGKTWFEVPPSMKVTFTGSYSDPCTARDLTLKVMERLGTRGALNRAVEFLGPAIDELSLDGRITLCSQVTEMGGIIGFCLPGGEALEYVKARTGRTDFPDITPDPDASYIEELTIDLNNLEPLIARPGSPADVVPVRDVAGTRIHSVFIGSCTNGRVSDIEEVARVLKGKKVADGIMVKVVPTTKEAFGSLLKSGALEALYDAGAIVSNPGCGGCAAGQIGMTGKGEVAVSTTNRNFRGKQGDGETYLASPLTAAYSALTGKITVPEG